MTESKRKFNTQKVLIIHITQEFLLYLLYYILQINNTYTYCIELFQII